MSNQDENTTNVLEKSLSTTSAKMKGSVELLNGLKRGDISNMMRAFGKSHFQVTKVVSGVHFGDPEVVECAVELVKFYEDVQLTNKVDEIINKHADAYKNRN